MSDHAPCPLCGEPVSEGISYQNKTWHEACVAQVIVAEASVATPEDRINEIVPDPNQPQMVATGCCLRTGLGMISDVLFPLGTSLLLGAAAAVMFLLFCLQLFSPEASWLMKALAVLVGVVTGGWGALYVTTRLLTAVWLIRQGAEAITLVFAIIYAFSRRHQRQKSSTTPMICPACRRQVKDGVQIQGFLWHPHCVYPQAPTAAKKPFPERKGALLVEAIFEALELPLVFAGGVIAGAVPGFVGGGAIASAINPSGDSTLWTYGVLMGVFAGGLAGAWSAIRWRYRMLAW